MNLKKCLIALVITLDMAGLAPGVLAQATGGASGMTPVQQTVSMQDKQFITNATQANLAEIRMNQLALQRSTIPKIQALANQMLQDHTKANSDLAQIAGTLGVTPPQTPNLQQQAMYDQLSKASATAFDRDFLQHMAQAHQDAVTLFQTESARGQATELRNYSLTYLPELQNHLASIQQQQIAMQQPGATPQAQTPISQQTSGQTTGTESATSTSQTQSSSSQNQSMTTPTKTQGSSTVRGYW
jgi:putative membrane protein